MSSQQHPEHAEEQQYIDRANASLEAELDRLKQPPAAADVAAEARLAEQFEKRASELTEAQRQICFGRIDREEKGPVYVGRHVIRDGPSIMVCSWRAPAAAPFYRATPDDPMGITRRRTLNVEGRRLRSLADEYLTALPPGTARAAVGPAAVTRPLRPANADDVTRLEPAPASTPEPPSVAAAGPNTGRLEQPAEVPPMDGSRSESPPSESGAAVDGEPPATPSQAPLPPETPAFDAVLADLERERTSQMGDIVTSIQADQYRLISEPPDGVLAIQGGPGTGKTAVALHRAAWLLFNFRERLGASGILVVGPNRAFMDYIAQVLPSLGESFVAQLDIGRLVPGSRAQRSEGRPATQRLKGDPRMATLLERLIWSFVKVPDEPLRLDLAGGRIHIDPDAIGEAVDRQRSARRSYAEARQHFRGVLEHAAYESFEAKGLGLRRKPATSEFQRALRGNSAWQGAFRRMWPALEVAQVLISLRNEDLLERLSVDLLTPIERKLLAGSITEEAGWTESDLPLLDEIAAILTGRESTYAYVIVDEAQDLTPMQLRMVSRRSQRGDMTLVGDIAQSTGAWHYRDWSEIAEHLPTGDDARLAELLIGYRVPMQIMEIASPLLPHIAPSLTAPRAVRPGTSEPGFRRTGEVELGQTVTQIVTETIDHRPGKIAVVVPQTLVNRTVADLQAEGIRAGELVKDGLRERVTVLTAERSKGLEFDNVVVVEPAAIFEEARYGPNELYVAITRATQHLEILYARDLPDVFRGVRDEVPADSVPVGAAIGARAPDVPVLTSRFTEALISAKLLHGRQRRRGTVVPYMAHLMAVASLVLEDGGTEDEAIAALLHDAPEDHGGDTILEDIRERFGDAVADIVRDCSDPVDGAVNNDWRDLKTRHVVQLEDGQPSVRRVALAEKLDNARNMVRMHREIGAAMWSRMGVEADDLLWYYRTVAELFRREHPGAHAAELWLLISELEAGPPVPDADTSPS